MRKHSIPAGLRSVCEREGLQSGDGICEDPGIRILRRGNFPAVFNISEIINEIFENPMFFPPFKRELRPILTHSCCDGAYREEGRAKKNCSFGLRLAIIEKNRE